VTLRVGVVGAGMMGAAHVRTLREQVPGCEVVAVFDADAGRAHDVAAGAATPASAETLIASPDVDAVVICSPDFTHAELVLACVGASKPVMCEKPLALTVAESLSLVEAEVALGHRVVQVGFMRRYDAGFSALREALRAGELGEARLAHLVHRNASSTTSTTSANLVTGSMIHELDQLRWLLDDEIVSIEVRSPIAEGFQDPQLATIEMRSGLLATVDVYVNASYGYDVRCELVGSRGAAISSAVSPLRTFREGHEHLAVTPDFVVRFGDAYRNELIDWVLAAEQGGASGASTWDGHLANVAAAAGVESLETQRRVQIPLQVAPTVYA
jgi:myo-inositol 2-dehydrogenase / D-chiro-inositol 1-dehydrogenase